MTCAEADVWLISQPTTPTSASIPTPRQQLQGFLHHANKCKHSYTTDAFGLPEEEQRIAFLGFDSQSALCTVTPLVPSDLLSRVGEDSLTPLLHCGQVHQHGGYTLPTVALLWVDSVMEVVMVRFILLTIDIV